MNTFNTMNYARGTLLHATLGTYPLPKTALQLICFTCTHTYCTCVLVSFILCKGEWGGAYRLFCRSVRSRYRILIRF
jgi:hypothetical protein